MRTKKHLLKALNSVFNRYNYEIIDRKVLYEWQKRPGIQRTNKQSWLPEEATAYLRYNNPRLKDLNARYSVFSSNVTAPLVWKEGYVSPHDILYFRGDNAYVWQLSGGYMNILAYALTMFYVKSIDTLGLLEKMEEDCSFGVFAFRIGDKYISRDLLDSIIEIYFLEKHLSVSLSSDLTILDIGAGYGRLAHRMLVGLPNIQKYICTDAIAVSTFISEYYLRFRNMEERAKVVPLDEVENTLRNRVVDIALNIHSFSECQISAIDWWLSLLKKYSVKYLMIVPNSGNPLLTNDGKDFSHIIENNGYKLKAKDPKYRDPVVQEYAINPTHHYLFELQ